MNILEQETKDLQALFSTKKLIGEGEVASKNISPSKLYCPAYEAFKLTGVPMAGQEESFETRGYAEAGNSRHQTIQKFLKDNPEVEWVDPGKYIEENNLPFVVHIKSDLRNFMERFPEVSVEEAREITGDYEVNLIHKTQPLSFQLDGLIKYRGEYYIVEIKTVSKKDLSSAPLTKHQWQGKCYSFLLKVPKVCWVYESREDFKIKVAVQLVENEEHQQVRNRLNSIILNKEHPEKLTRNTDKCKYCRYFRHCLEVFVAKDETSENPF